MAPNDKNIRYLAEHLLHTGLGGVSERERHALTRISKRLQSIQTDSIPEDGVTLGERMADAVAEFGGSWIFISIFTTVLIGWAVLNTSILRSHAFDPYPYVFLNLVLSMLAAIQAPIIMMSQSRQAARDRMTMIRDFEVNLKSEAALAELNKRLDHLSWQVLDSLNEIKRQQHNPKPHNTESTPKF